MSRAREKADKLENIVDGGVDGIAAARERWRRGDLMELGPLPLSAVARQPDGTVGFYMDVQSHECSQRKDKMQASFSLPEHSCGTLDPSCASVETSPMPSPSATLLLLSPPRFVCIERLRRERACGCLWHTGYVTVTYSLSSAQEATEVQPSSLVHPAEAHRRLAAWYHAYLEDGHTHDETIMQLEMRSVRSAEELSQHHKASCLAQLGKGPGVRGKGPGLVHGSPPKEE